MRTDTRIGQFCKIVSECQHANIEGFSVDLFSASAVVQVYDRLNAINRDKYARMAVPKMVAVAFRLANAAPGVTP